MADDSPLDLSQNDTPHLAGLRLALVDKLNRNGITQPDLLEALATVWRHVFVDSALAELAYKDQALPLAAGQTISQPYTVAYQTQLLDPHPGDEVLEIGTGSGYQAAILAEMGVQVYSIERHAELHQRAKRVLDTYHFPRQPILYLGDGTQGWPEPRHFDGILVTAAAPEVPQPLLEQLKLGGRLVIPVGNSGTQVMTRVTRTGQDDYETERFDDFVFVPLIGQHGWAEGPQ